MKITARISRNTVLVEMTEEELLNITGEDFNFVKTGEYNLYNMTVGTEYRVGEAWNRLQEQAQVASKLEGVSKTLAALSDLVTQTKVAYIAAKPEGENENH